MTEEVNGLFKLEIGAPGTEKAVIVSAPDPVEIAPPDGPIIIQAPKPFGYQKANAVPWKYDVRVEAGASSSSSGNVEVSNLLGWD